MTRKRDQDPADDDVIEPLYGKGLKRIHPAIGTVDDTAYVGVWLPSRIYNAAAQTEVEREVFHLITSKRERIPANVRELRKRGWELLYEVSRIRGSAIWLLEDVQAFLNDSTSVDPVEVYEKRVLGPFQEYMDYLDPDTYHLLALWTVAAVFHHLFNSFPYLYLGGTKGSGKTKTLTLLACLCLNAIPSGNISTSAMFRLVQNLRATLLIDETEKLGFDSRSTQVSETTREFRNLLLNGYKKGWPVHRTERTKNDQFVVDSFDVYSPKAIANIGGLDDVLEDRCIIQFLLTAKDVDKKNSTPEITDPRWEQSRAHLYRLYLDFWHEVQMIYEELGQLKGNLLVQFLKKIDPKASDGDLARIAGRQLELWKPILTLARFLDLKSPNLELTKKVVGLAIRNVNQKITENLTEAGDMILVRTLLGKVGSKDWKDDYISISNIRDAMKEAFEGEENWLTPAWVGRALRRLGFQDKRRLGKERQIRVLRKDVQEVATRYGISMDNSLEPSQPSQASLESSIEHVRSDGSDTSDAFPETPIITQDLVQSVLATFTKLEKESETGEIDEEFLVRNITNDEHLTTVDRAKQVVATLIKDGFLFYPKLGFLRRINH